METKGFKADSFCEEPVFCCTNGAYYNSKSIIAFDKGVVYEDPGRIHELLGDKEKLFVPNDVCE